MKKSLIITCVTLIAILSGCSLKEVNTRIPVADTYFKTQEGATKLTNSIYSYLQGLYGSVQYYLTEMGTDLWMIGGDGQKEFSNYTITPSTGNTTSYWDTSYRGITAANTLIDRAGDIEADQAVVNDLLGQAYFLRAYFYSNLAMQFGGVPLPIHEVKEVQTEATRASVEEVYDQAIEDLKQAVTLLPDTPTAFGRPCKTTAQALLARVCLWAEKWQDAADAAKAVINSGKYRLLDNYADIFLAGNVKNDEVIWVCSQGANDALNSRSMVNCMFTVRYDTHGGDYGMVRDILNGRPFRHFMPTRHYLDMQVANMDWDSRFESIYKWVWYVNDESKCKANPGAHKGDTALYVPPFAVSAAQRAWAEGKYRIEDINDYFDPNSEGGMNTITAREMYPQIMKFDDPTRATVGESNTKTLIVIRLAEMYLIAAEALMNTNNKAAGVEYLNAVRKRAARSEALYEANKLSADQLTIEAILEERALELGAECVGRWPDLKRTGKLLEWVRAWNPDAKDNLSEKFLLRPIPTTMMDRVMNKDEVKQNPGY